MSETAPVVREASTGPQEHIIVERASLASSVLRLMRPQQWTKNMVVLAALFFSGQAGDVDQVVRALLALLAFCLVSSAVYVFNDWHDRVEDRLHPTKRYRPIAAREIRPGVGLVIGSVLLAGALVVASMVSGQLAEIVSVYAATMTAYTLWFRRIAIVDVLTIAGGFVLRALAGAVAVDVPISVWLFVCTLLLALLLGLGKRRQELRLLAGHTEHRRPSLTGYARIDIDRAMLIAAGLTVGAYVLYTLAVPTFGRSLPMFITTPFVVIAILRYLFLVFRRNLGGTPELMFLRDAPFLAGILAWVASVAIVLTS